jgi:hypothetical protein
MGYWLAFLGLPFAFGTALEPSVVSPVAGAVLAALLASSALCLWKWRNDAVFLKKALPWLALALMPVINATLATVGRVGFGRGQALAQRYITLAIPLPIGLACLAVLIFRRWRASPSPACSARPVAALLAAGASAFAFLHFLSVTSELDSWRETQHDRLTAKALVETINLADEPGLLRSYLHPSALALKDRINFLNRIGYLHPGLIQSKSIREIGTPSDPGSFAYGQIQQMGKNAKQEHVAAGWAILPEKMRPADAVMLTCDDADGQPVLFAVADVVIRRADVVNVTHRKEFLRSGWVKVFSPRDLPPGGVQSLKAWAFDAETCRAYRIEGMKRGAPPHSSGAIQKCLNCSEAAPRNQELKKLTSQALLFAQAQASESDLGE